jgi:hypothetical protein
MAEVLSEAAIAEVEEKSTVQDNRLLVAILDRADGSIAQWAEDCGWFFAVKQNTEGKDEKPKPNRSLVQRVLKRLTDDGLVKKEGKIYGLTKVGRKAAQAAQVSGKLVEP